MASEIGAEEAEEVGVEHLLRYSNYYSNAHYSNTNAKTKPSILESHITFAISLYIASSKSI